MYVYVVGPTSHPLLIDGHYDYDVKETIAAMENAGIKTGNVRAILITHAHDDHFGSAGALAKWSRAPIWSHVATATEIEDPWSGFAAGQRVSQCNYGRLDELPLEGRRARSR